MTKKPILVAVAVIVVIVGVTAGIMINKKANFAGLSMSLFEHTQCVNQKCVITNTPGQNQCSTDSNCSTANDPENWCKAHNPGVDLISTAVKYPNGNFSCDCYYINKDGSHSQTTCTNYHLQ